MNTYRAIELVDGLIEPDDDFEVIEAWQHLLNTGEVWTLPGRYARVARNMIDNGVIVPLGEKAA